MLRLLSSALLMFFLPGYTLINAIYPGRGELDEELDLLYRIIYGIGLSVAVVVIIGFMLGHVPGGEFTAGNISVSLISFTVFFFFVGWYRGAYQSLGHLSPRLTRAEPEVVHHKDEDANKVKRLQKVAKKRADLKEDIKHSKNEGERKKAKRQLEKVEKRLKKLEKEREEDF
ncbi:MAG: DUF1616 domain-containing protein [Candidatus Thermoplasmatota archaeon]|nr:DUF1616 domain-containing protein [Candidatus Thermoplasmatota archaeon]MBS3790691.1 DUF1616 domain-containing protein [Candidatus Thermoplasmatota archaeon]